MRRFALLAVLILAVGLAGCGGADYPVTTPAPEQPTDTPTAPAEPTVTPTETAGEETTTSTATRGSTATATPDPTPTATRESTPTAAPDPTPTATAAPPTATASPSPTATASPSPTPTAAPSPTRTAEPTPTESDGGGDDGGGDGEADQMLVHHINVGQADATLIETPAGETMLIDSGDWRDDGETVIDYLETHDVERIDYLVATHAHSDHIGGHAPVIRHYETEKGGIGQAWDSGVPHSSQTYEDYLDAVDEHDVDLIDAQEGDEIPMENVTVELFNPPAENDSEDLHYNSMALHVEYGHASFLFTGDAEANAERRMIDEHGTRLNADVFHAGHHGSKTSSTDDMIEAVEPQFTVISSGYDSQYDHPSNETLERFADHEVDAYWTGTHGTIVSATDGEVIAVGTHHNVTNDPRELRDADEATADPSDPVEERERYQAQNTKAEFSYASATAAAVVAMLLLGRRRF